MIKLLQLLRASAFVLAVVMSITIMHPFNVTDTHAAEREVSRVTLIDDGERTTHETTARTVGAFLNEIRVEIGPYDTLTPHYRRRMENRLTIRIYRAFYVDLVVDGQTESRQVGLGTTAGEVLSALQLSSEMVLLFDGDKEEELEYGAALEFSTWRSEQEMFTEVIEYPTEYVSTQSLSMGVEYVRQEGTTGERRIEYKVIFIGNEEYSREVVEEVITKPVPRIVDRGVGWTLGALTDTSCPSFHYVRRVTMNASAYTAGPGCTGKSPGHPLYGITASGRRVEHGIVAVDPRVIPLGTRLYVEGYGFALAADTGGAIRGYKIDLFMYDLADAIRFGRRDITVFILDEF